MKEKDKNSNSAQSARSVKKPVLGTTCFNCWRCPVLDCELRNKGLPRSNK